jgi:hypothetical protein
VPPVEKELLNLHEHMCSLPSSYLPKLTKVPPVEKELLTLHEHMSQVAPWSTWAGRNSGVNTCTHEGLAVPSLQVAPWSTWAKLTKVSPVEKELLTLHEHMCSLPSSYLLKLTKVPPVEKELLTLHEHICSLPSSFLPK